jgi:uncharacterized membrane protein YbhN (UPF0104 family)
VRVPLYKSLLGAFCKSPPWPAMMAVTWLPSLGKYMPGKVASVAGVVYMLQKYKVPARISLSMVLMASGAMVIMGVMLSVPTVLWEPVQKTLPFAWVLCVVIAAAGLVCLHPKVFKSAGNFVLKKLKRQQLEVVPSLKDWIFPIIATFAQYLFMGLAMWFMVRSLVPIGWGWLWFYICACALAAMAGVIAFFAPGGLGVREGILLVALAASADKPIVAVCVVGTRLLQIIADVGFAGAAVAILKWGDKPSAADDVPAAISQEGKS